MKTRLQCCLVVLLAAVATSAAAVERRAVALGFLADRSTAAALPELPQPRAEEGPFVRLVVRQGEIAADAERFEWGQVETVVARLHAAGYRPVLCLTGARAGAAEGGAATPFVEEFAARWTAFVRSAVHTFAPRVAVFEIWDRPDASVLTPDEYAYLMKVSALAARAEARAQGAQVRIAQGAVDPAALAWQRDLWARDLAAYVDILPARVRATAGGGCEETRSVFDEAVLHPPAPEVWAYVEPGDGAPPARVAVRCLAGPATAALGLLSGDPPELAREAAWTVGLHRLLGGGFAPAPPGKLELSAVEGAPAGGRARVLGRFVDDEDFSTLVVVDGALDAGTLKQEGVLVLDVPDARDAQIIDPATGATRPSGVRALPGAPARKGATIELGSEPTVLFYRRSLPPGLDLGAERLDVAQDRGLTVEEILARHQEVRRVEDDRLQRWVARGRVDYHFKLAQGGGTFDVGIESNYFWERGAALEWEQTDFYVNGNRVTWKSIPELPFIQPEKVVTVPLDLTLDRTYTYRLDGQERIGARDAYVVAFEPADPGAPLSLYRGRVFIDKESFVRLRLSVLQTGLEAPVLSNEERDDFELVAGPDGETFPLIVRSNGQQLWTVGGRNVVVTRSVVMTSFEINLAADEFERRRRAAYASSHIMMRDTQQGFRYLERGPGDTRTLQEKPDTSQIFAVGGAYHDASLAAVVPLAGFNWFDFDVAQKNIQMNVFFAGVLAFFTTTDPDLFGSGLDGTVEATLFALERTDKVFLGETELEDRTLDYRSQSISARLGIPVGPFVKFTAIGNLETLSFSRADETAAAFVLPSDHRAVEGTLQAEFNRQGYTVTAAATAAHRSRWEPWGIPDAGGGFPAFRPSHDDYARYRLSGFKEWYLPRFQKVRAGIDWLDGDDLDRFSAFQFSYFGDTGLAGFAGSGIRFERGTVARVGWSFNLFEAVRFDVSLESARARQQKGVSAAQSHTGIALSGNFVAPWKTIVSVGYGRALSSGIPEIEGQQEFLLAVYKLF